MNRIFKVIWSKAKNCYIVASELAKSRTKAPKSNMISHALSVSVLTAIFSFGALQSVYAATIADYPLGFAGRGGSTWSATSLPDSTLITDWQASGGDIAFRVQSGQVFVVVDGKFYQNEGRYRVLDESDCAFAGGTASGFGSIAIGSGASATASGTSSLAIGSGAFADVDESIAIGPNASAPSRQAIALGVNTNKTSNFGGVYSNNADFTNSISLGTGAMASALKACALGNDAVAPYQNSVAIGSQSVTHAENTISFGCSATDVNWKGIAYDSDLKRRLTFVADGIDNHDVATWGQTKVETRPADNGNYVKS